MKTTLAGIEKYLKEIPEKSKICPDYVKSKPERSSRKTRAKFSSRNSHGEKEPRQKSSEFLRKKREAKILSQSVLPSVSKKGLWFNSSDMGLNK